MIVPLCMERQSRNPRYLVGGFLEGSGVCRSAKGLLNLPKGEGVGNQDPQTRSEKGKSCW